MPLSASSPRAVVLFDIDGVMTDGGILADLEGQLYRTFDAKDGFAVRMACLNGFPVGVITALVGAPFFAWLLRRTDRA